MKKINTLKAALLSTLVFSQVALSSQEISIQKIKTEENLPINSYTMGAIVGDQLIEKFNTTEKLGLKVDRKDFMFGVLDSITGKINITEEDKKLILASLEKNKQKEEKLAIGVQKFEGTDVTYKIIKEGTGKLAHDENKVKIKYSGYLENGNKFTEETAVISLKEARSTGMNVVNILEKMPEGSTYEFNVPHYLDHYKKDTLNNALVSWVKDEPLLKKDSYFQHVIPHQLAYHGNAEKEMKPYSSLTFIIEVVDII